MGNPITSARLEDMIHDHARLIVMRDEMASLVLDLTIGPLRPCDGGDTPCAVTVVRDRLLTLLACVMPPEES